MLKKLFCKLGIHKFSTPTVHNCINYYTNVSRKCLYCNKKEYLICNGDPEFKIYWKAVRKYNA